MTSSATPFCERLHAGMTIQLKRSRNQLSQELRAMLKSRLLGSAICVCFALVAVASQARAADCEDKIARHMVGEAMLAAQFVAAAERNGMTSIGINGILKEVADNSGIQGFWITDSAGERFSAQNGERLQVHLDAGN